MNKKIGVYLYALADVKRFNRFYHPSGRRQDYATHGYNSLAISSVIGYQYNVNHPHAKINMERVYGKLIFGSLHPSFFGDVPKSIQHQYPDLFNSFAMARQINGEQVVVNFSDKYRTQFYDYIVESKENSLEGEIVKQAENISVLMKCEEELKSRSNRYLKKLKNIIREHVQEDKPLIISEEIQEELCEERYDNFEQNEFYDIYLDTVRSILSSKIDEVIWFFKNVYFTPFTLIIKNMQEVLRWNNKDCKSDTDSQHSFYVAMWSFILGLIERTEYNKQVDISTIVSKAIFHDIHESLTSDLLSYVKRINPEIKSLVDIMENDKNGLILKLTPESLQDIFYSFICDPKSNDNEGHILHIADKIDAMIKSLYELKNRPNDSYFLESYDKSMREIMGFANDYLSIKDFCTFMLHEFRL